MIAVKKACRGMGIGTRMLGFLEETVDRDKIFLAVADFNPDARRFYERMGYRPVGGVPDLYRKGITEYLMYKEL